MKRVYSSVLSRTALVPDPATRSLISRILASSTYAVGTFVALGTFGVDTSPVLAAMGISGATIGFACKDVGANMVAGLSLAASRPFEHGRTISVGAFKGLVDHWDTRYLYLRGPKGELIHVPNSVVFTSVITVHDPPESAFQRDKQGDVMGESDKRVKQVTDSVRGAVEDVAGDVSEAQQRLTRAGDRTVHRVRMVSWVFTGLVAVFIAAVIFLAYVFDTVVNDENSIFTAFDRTEKRALTLWQRAKAAMTGTDPAKVQ
uniref:Mechanosensitive ion channel n=1 Tax=Neobodo designis TaxID=312471 RepID=A0A7S1QXZ9_NEODS|mmetsp:Transcript_54216/g.166807  ORF Transcript_54216/g.166807 Transcript_54216/m.166807 type:complete len:259 (+) Transcript_54216:92-868(+)